MAGANTGKDTIASILVKNHGAVSFSLADPIKYFAYKCFKFTEEQLWGPSELRDLPDKRYESEDFRRAILESAWCGPTTEWVKDVCSAYSPEEQGQALEFLRTIIHNKIIVHAESNPITPRYFLQQVGTTWGRAIDGNLWTKYAINTAQLLATGDFTYSAKNGFDRKDINDVPKLIVISDGRFLNEVQTIKEANGVIWRINSPQAVVRSEHVSETEQQTMPDNLFTIIINNDKSNGLEALERLIKMTYGWTVKGQLFDTEP